MHSFQLLHLTVLPPRFIFHIHISIFVRPCSSSSSSASSTGCLHVSCEMGEHLSLLCKCQQRTFVPVQAVGMADGNDNGWRLAADGWQTADSSRKRFIRSSC